MALSLTHKIIRNHLISGSMVKGEPITLKIDQTLTQDSTGTMVYLQLASLPTNPLKTDISVAYIDHNTLQAGFENADDHDFIQSAAEKYGLVFVKPGGGICHQVHLETFGVPGKTLIGSDSHTPTGGGLGMLAIGAGGLDVALGMAKGSYTLSMPRVVQIDLKNKLNAFSTAKDVALSILQKLTVKGGVHTIFEYTGEGVKSLSIPERATICNMGAELGATTSLFPSDEHTLNFLTTHHRAHDFIPLCADDGALYDETLVIDLDAIEPLVAKPHSPDCVSAISALPQTAVDQVAIGSCTNGSFEDLIRVASILKGRTISPRVSLVISPGSARTLIRLSQCGALNDLIQSGARILESSCGPCIGMGQAPKSGAISLRTFNRNFKGRCGTSDANVYLCSPETAAFSAITGFISSPSQVDSAIYQSHLMHYQKCDHALDTPVHTAHVVMPTETATAKNHDLRMGPNIKPFPIQKPIHETIGGKVVLKVADDITTDDIMPSHAGLLPYRSNIPHLAQFCFNAIDPEFSDRATAHSGGLIVAGHNYGQGSSREHAALAPLQLGIRLVIAKSFARIHRANLINAGIIPLTFINEADYDLMELNEPWVIHHIKEHLATNTLELLLGQSGRKIPLHFSGSDDEKATLLAGGTLNRFKEEERHV